MPPDKDEDPVREHLFEYPHRGSHYCFTLPAHSHEEAEEIVAQLAYTKHLGKVEAKITVPTVAAAPVGLLVRLVTWWKNATRRPRG